MKRKSSDIRIFTDCLWLDDPQRLGTHHGYTHIGIPPKIMSPPMSLQKARADATKYQGQGHWEVVASIERSDKTLGYIAQ